jgi:hypothetical protein
MATRVCPQCGSQYVASVRRCIDCDVVLVDDVGPDGEAAATVATPLGEGDQIAYELDGWGNQLRVTLSGMLDLAEIPHVWEVGALVVAAPHEEAVDEFIAAVEGGEGEELDADVPQVAFEIEGVSADELAELDAELIAAHIPHAWQETGELLVPEVDEDTVADLIDAVLNPSDEHEDDGLATHAALDRLFVVVDKLGKDPTDRKLIDRYESAAADLDGLGIPYGMSGADWSTLLAQVEEVRLLVTGDPARDGTGAAADADEPAGSEDLDPDGAAAPDDQGEPGADAAADDVSEPETETDDAVDAEDGDGADGDADDGEAPLDPKVRAADLLHQLRTRMLDLV